MHELAVAAALFEWADEQARAHAPRALKSIELELDGMSCLSPDALRFGFEAICAGTPLTGVTLDFAEVSPKYRCELCGAVFSSQESPLVCSGCGAPLPRILQESSLRIRSIEVD